jgi:hydrogenase-4 component F
MSLFSFNPIIALLLTSLVAAVALAFVRDYRRSARLNILASFVMLLFALLLFRGRPPIDDLLLADDLNVVFIALNAFVGFTTSVFSASCSAWTWR